MQSQTDSVYYGGKPPKKEEKNKDPKAWKKNVTFGGDLQVFLGTYTFIYLSPTIGYSPIKKLNVAVGPVYNYLSDGRYRPRFSQSIFGGHSVVRYRVLPVLSLIGQYDLLSQPDYFSATPNKKAWVNYGLAGLGYTQSVGNNATFYTSLLYNLTPNRLSIYPSNFIFQLGFSAGF